ncbi:acyl carrier protein, partial [Streptomyces sp. NPDC000851]
DTTAVPSGAARGAPCPPAPAEDLPDSLAELTHRLVCRVGGHDPGHVHDHSRLHEDLGFDSIRVMELKARIEHALPRLGELPVEDLLASLRTVGDLVRYLRSLHLTDAPVPAAPEGTPR